MIINLPGEDIYRKTNICRECGCVFRTTREDAIVIYDYDKDIVHRFFECPSCYNIVKFKEKKEVEIVILKKKEE